MNRTRKFATPETDRWQRDHNADGTLKHYSQVKLHKENPVRTDDFLGAGVGLIGAASVAATSLAPVAAAAGIGYGVYKVGQSLSLW